MRFGLDHHHQTCARMSLTPEEQDLLRLVESSFPQAQAPPDKLTNCGCPECRDLDTAFRGRKWNEIPDSVVEYEHGSLPSFSDEAFRYFLPAYLHRSIRDYPDMTAVPEFLLYALAPDAFNLPRCLVLS